MGTEVLSRAALNRALLRKAAAAARGSRPALADPVTQAGQPGPAAPLTLAALAAPGPHPCWR